MKRKYSLKQIKFQLFRGIEDALRKVFEHVEADMRDNNLSVESEFDRVEEAVTGCENAIYGCAQDIVNLENDVSDLSSGKYDKTGGTISGNVDITGTLRQRGDAQFDGTVDIVPRRCSASLSSAGWYRVLTVTNQGRAPRAWVIDLTITRAYQNYNNEAHCIRLIGIYDSFTFTEESSKSNIQFIDKIRYTRNGSTGYLDIHYSASVSNLVSVNFEVNTEPEQMHRFNANALESVADAPSGETVLATYTFAANTDDSMSVVALGKTWSFRKRNGIVYMLASGDITSASSGVNTVTTLPNGWNPETIIHVPCGNNPNAVMWVYITTAGVVALYTATTISSATNGAFSASWIANS